MVKLGDPPKLVTLIEMSKRKTRPDWTIQPAVMWAAVSKRGIYMVGRYKSCVKWTSPSQAKIRRLIKVLVVPLPIKG